MIQKEIFEKKSLKQQTIIHIIKKHLIQKELKNTMIIAHTLGNIYSYKDLNSLKKVIMIVSLTNHAEICSCNFLYFMKNNHKSLQYQLWC